MQLIAQQRTCMQRIKVCDNKMNDFVRGRILSVTLRGSSRGGVWCL